MECRPVEIKVISASGIKDVNTLSKMDVYVVVSVSGDPRSVQRSPIDKDGGTNPKWNHYEMKFIIDEVAAQNSRIGFVFQIMSNRTLGDKEAGRVYIPVKELLDLQSHAEEVEYQVRTQSGKLKGKFKFSYSFGDKFTQKSPPIEDSPMSYSAAGPGFPPSGFPVAVPYAVPYPSYQYAMQPPGYTTAPYGCTAAGGVGSGMGAVAGGIGIGLLGGMLIGEMVDDSADFGI